MGATLPLVLAIASAIVAVLAFIRAARAEGSQRTKFIVLGLVLVGFTVLNGLQVATLPG